MKKTVPFKKEIMFKTNIAEVVSISLENTLHKTDNSITGEFIVSGEYKVTDTSSVTENFMHNLPFDIDMDEKYDLSKAHIDIDDFYYEILNDNTLVVNIEVGIDKVEEQLIPVKKEVIHIENAIIDEPVREEVVEIELKDIQESIEKVNSNAPDIFNTITNEIETYKTYHVHIVREGDTLELILEKYSITVEMLSDYNDLSELKLGNKLIIPC